MLAPRHGSVVRRDRRDPIPRRTRLSPPLSLTHVPDAAVRMPPRLRLHSSAPPPALSSQPQPRRGRRRARRGRPAHRKIRRRPRAARRRRRLAPTAARSRGALCAADPRRGALRRGRGRAPRARSGAASRVRHQREGAEAGVRPFKDELSGAARAGADREGEAKGREGSRGGGGRRQGRGRGGRGAVRGKARRRPMRPEASRTRDVGEDDAEQTAKARRRRRPSIRVGLLSESIYRSRGTEKRKKKSRRDETADSLSGRKSSVATRRRTAPSLRTNRERFAITLIIRSERHDRARDLDERPRQHRRLRAHPLRRPRVTTTNATRSSRSASNPPRWGRVTHGSVRLSPRGTAP